VVDRKGKIIHELKNAICLGSLFGKPLGNRCPVLFQVVMTKEYDCAKGDNRIQIVDSDIKRYLKATVHSDMCKRYIAKHTAVERMQFGVPIVLFDVPRNAPLLVSTHIRWPWDRHNNKYNSNIFYLKENYRMTWQEAMFIGSVVDSVPTSFEKTFNVYSYSHCHSPFGSGMTLDMVRRYCQRRFPHEKMGLPIYDSLSQEDRISSFFAKGGGVDFNTFILDNMAPLFPGKESWGVVRFPMESFHKAVNYLLQRIREGEE
jgi:hypothetical protein